MTEVSRRAIHSNIPRTADPEAWRDEPLRTFVEYVVALGEPGNEHLRRLIALQDLVRIGRNALANEDLRKIAANQREARRR